MWIEADVADHILGLYEAKMEAERAFRREVTPLIVEHFGGDIAYGVHGWTSWSVSPVMSGGVGQSHMIAGLNVTITTHDDRGPSTSKSHTIWVRREL